jgi:signal transduction histidine kinase
VKRFQDMSLKRKLTAASFLTSAAAVLVVSFLFTANGVQADREALTRQLTSQAGILGFTVVPALTFRDERAAKEALAALRAERQIREAAIFRQDGSLFASYLRDGESSGLPAVPAGESEQMDFFAGSFALTRPIADEHGRPLGSIYLQTDLATMRNRIYRTLAFNASVLGVSLVAALVMATVLQREISTPVLDLVKIARTVAQEKDYGVRAAVRGRDELGVLVESFNEMLNEIEARDAQLRKVNQQLHQRTEELGRKNEEVEAFVYIVSHDLRAPLVNLQGFARELRMNCEALAERLAGAPLPPEQAAKIRELTDHEIPTSLRFISASSDKFEKLINALLQLSRSGRRELAIEPLDMRALVKATLDSLMRLVDESGAEVVIDRLPPAHGDATAIGQVWSNLLTNALRYLQPGRKGKIFIRGESHDGFCRYHVQDNGVGMAPAAQHRLFQVFQRMRPDLAEGEGIGLATVKRIVERHGGHIWAESAEGVGTTFTFSLPAGLRKEGFSE